MAQTSTQGCRCVVCHIFNGQMPTNDSVSEHTLRWIPSEQVLCMEIGFRDEEKLDVEERLKQLVPWCKNENWHPLMLNSIWKADRADGTNKYTRLQMSCLPHFQWTDADKSWHPFAHCGVCVLPRSTIATRLLAGATFTDFDDISSTERVIKFVERPKFQQQFGLGLRKPGGETYEEKKWSATLPSQLGDPWITCNRGWSWCHQGLGWAYLSFLGVSTTFRGATKVVNFLLVAIWK